MIMIMARAACVSGLVGVAAVALGKIADPSLAGLVSESPTVLVGEAIAVFPTLTSPVGVLLVALVIAASVTRAVRRQSWQRTSAAALGTFIAAAATGTAISIPASFVVPQAVAIVRTSETFRGTPHRYVPVFFGTAFVCDVSGVQRRGEYLLFLKGRWPLQNLSWYDWSIWRVEGKQAQNLRREWTSKAPLPVSLFRNAVVSSSVPQVPLAH